MSCATAIDCSCAGPPCWTRSTHVLADDAEARENEGSQVTAVQRTPVVSRGRRVPGLYVRATNDGREVFEYRARLEGRVVTYKPEARSRTEAVAELEQLRSEVRKGGLAMTDRRMTLAQLSTDSSRPSTPTTRIRPAPAMTSGGDSGCTLSRRSGASGSATSTPTVSAASRAR